MNDHPLKELLLFRKTSLPYTEELHQVVINHGLEGWVLDESADVHQRKTLQMRRQTHAIRNILYREWADKIAAESQKQGWSLIALKGIVLLEDIYEDFSQRSLGDIDLLVAQEHWSPFIEWLKKQGFNSVQDEKWQANNFKACLSLVDRGVEVVIELHSRLFWSEKKEHIWKTAPFINDHFLKLSSSDMLVHLMGHLAYQHSFLKIHWLLDIYLFVKKHESSIDWGTVQELSEQLGHRYSTESVQMALLQCFDLKTPQLWAKPLDRTRDRVFKMILNWDFLSEPYKNKWMYYTLKHATMSSWPEAIEYDIKWLWNRLNSKRKKLFSKS